MSPSSTTCPTKSFWSRLAAPDEPGPAKKSRADWKRDIFSTLRRPGFGLWDSGYKKINSLSGSLGGAGKMYRLSFTPWGIFSDGRHYPFTGGKHLPAAIPTKPPSLLAPTSVKGRDVTTRFSHMTQNTKGRLDMTVLCNQCH